jgi:hypothetical protein
MVRSNCKRSEGQVEHDHRRSLPVFVGWGEAAQIIMRFDWEATPLGPIETWPTSLKSTVALILRSPVPIVTL